MDAIHVLLLKIRREIENGDEEMEHIDFIIYHIKRFASNPIQKALNE